MGRFLVTDDWDYLGDGITQKVLPCPLSVHSPVLLIGGPVRLRGPSPFRFENMWLKIEGFEDHVKRSWQFVEIRGLKSFIVA